MLLLTITIVSLACVSVDGGWIAWNSWGQCSTTCSIGTQSRQRTCTNPAPQYPGQYCVGDHTEYRACFERSCADGGWSSWSLWSTCSNGMKTKTRACNNPAPSTFGRACIGNDVDRETCGSTTSRGMVAFTVTSPNGHLVSSWRPVFTNIVTNIGGGYNPSTAEFTCPIAGLYMFSLTLETNSDNKISAWIQKNGANVIYAQLPAVFNSMSTATTFLELAVGDRVNVGDVYDWPHSSSRHGSSFSGVLLGN